MSNYQFTKEDITENVNIVEYIGQYVDLEKQNGEYFGLCPFHKDVNPSFSITPNSNCWYCFGCHEGGTVIEFARKMNRWSYPEAINRLAQYANLTSGASVQPRHLQATKLMRSYVPIQSKAKEATYKVLPDDVMDRYEPDSPALDLWRSEGIGDATMRKYLVRYDSVSRRIVFPITSPDGKIINISGRTVDPDFKAKGLPKYNYYTSLGRLDTLYALSDNIAAIKEKREVIVFEGAKSVFKADQWGYDNCVAALTSRINQYQLKLLVQMGCSVVIAFDSDVRASEIDTVKMLKRFVPVYIVTNRDKLLAEKMSPVDSTKEVWDYLYRNKYKLKA